VEKYFGENNSKFDVLIMVNSPDKSGNPEYSRIGFAKVVFVVDPGGPPALVGQAQSLILDHWIIHLPTVTMIWVTISKLKGKNMQCNNIFSHL